MKTGSPRLFKNSSDYISILATIGLLIVFFIVGSILYPDFCSLQVVSNLFIDNAYLIVIVVGEALTIITGGIDLSVGSMVAFVSMIAAQLLQMGVSPIVVMLTVLVVGCVFGTVQGFLIQRFNLHPWIVTLAGMFFARGASYIISVETIPINDSVFSNISGSQIPIGFGAYTTDSVIVALVIVAAAVILMKYTRFGRTVYAIGGSENSAMLMGLPTDRTKILVYTISGFCSSLGGLLFTIYTLSGYALDCQGTEMDAIAACVVGGILLTGGYGFIIGPMFGVLVTGIIQSLITFNGTLNSWWTKVAVGMILFIFILLQRIVVIRNARQKASDIADEQQEDFPIPEGVPK